jgi:hypothetical protein
MAVLVTAAALVAAATLVFAGAPDMLYGGGGCASGVRSGFVDEFRFPCVAACSANGASPPFRGDVGGSGANALCAPGWHVCTVRYPGSLHSSNDLYMCMSCGASCPSVAVARNAVPVDGVEGGRE